MVTGTFRRLPNLYKPSWRRDSGESLDIIEEWGRYSFSLSAIFILTSTYSLRKVLETVSIWKSPTPPHVLNIGKRQCDAAVTLWNGTGCNNSFFLDIGKCIHVCYILVLTSASAFIVCLLFGTSAGASFFAHTWKVHRFSATLSVRLKNAFPSRCGGFPPWLVFARLTHVHLCFPLHCLATIRDYGLPSSGEFLPGFRWEFIMACCTVCDDLLVINVAIK